MKINYALALGLIGLAFATPAVMAEEAKDHVAASKETHASQMLDSYSSVSAALYKEDLAAAKKAAGSLFAHDKESAMGKHAQAIVDSKDIEGARMHFKELSDAAIPVAKTEKIMHQMHCPMAMDGKGADWLQKSPDEVQNPYMGAKMPHCGSMVK